MSLPASLRLTRDQLIEALEQETHHHRLSRRTIEDAITRRDNGLQLLDTAIETAHIGHYGLTATCVRGVCVDLRKARAAL